MGHSRGFNDKNKITTNKIIIFYNLSFKKVRTVLQKSINFVFKKRKKKEKK